jgi:hypothetical protein
MAQGNGMRENPEPSGAAGDRPDGQGPALDGREGMIRELYALGCELGYRNFCTDNYLRRNERLECTDPAVLEPKLLASWGEVVRRDYPRFLDVTAKMNIEELINTRNRLRHCLAGITAPIDASVRESWLAVGETAAAVREEPRERDLG